MSHKKASLSSHRDKGAAKKAAAYAVSEMKSATFRSGTKSGAEGKLPSVNKAPYSAKDGTNKGRCVTRNEHLALYDLHKSVDAMRDEHLDDIEFFYKVLCSAKRHMPLKKLESFRNHEGDSLVISTHKFLRMYEQRYKRPPPRSTMTNNTRMAYANSICNYHLTKGGMVIPGAYYNPETDPPLVSFSKVAPPDTIQVKSALNGAQGSVTGTDDVDNVHASLATFSACSHPWCSGRMRQHNQAFFYCFSVREHDCLSFANHWRLGDTCVIDLDLSHEENCDDCSCIACTLALLHSMHLAHSAINGNNGSYTNTDDHDSPSLCTKLSCKLGVHYHRAAKKRPSSGAAQRVAEKTAAKDSPKPVGELVKCVNELGVPIACACCEKLGDKFHLPRNVAVKKCDLVADAMVSDAEKEQGLQDADTELESTEYDYAESGAAGGGEQPLVLCTVIERAAEKKVCQTIEHAVEREPVAFISIPTAVSDDKLPSLSFTSNDDTPTERAFCSDTKLPVRVDLEDGVAYEITTLQLDDFLEEITCWSNSPPSPCSIITLCSDDEGDTTSRLIKHPGFCDISARRVIMINTALPPYKSVCARTWLYLTELVADVDRSPMSKVQHVDRSARLTTTLTATVGNSFLRLMFPASWTWEEESYDDFDLMAKRFYNATIERDVWPHLYDIGVRHFAFIPIGQYDSSKQVYSYFLARLITGMQELLSPEEKAFYDVAHRVQTTMNTYMSLSNALVLYHYQLIKAIGAH